MLNLIQRHEFMLQLEEKELYLYFAAFPSPQCQILRDTRLSQEHTMSSEREHRLDTRIKNRVAVHVFRQLLRV